MERTGREEAVRPAAPRHGKTFQTSTFGEWIHEAAINRVSSKGVAVRHVVRSIEFGSRWTEFENKKYIYLDHVMQHPATTKCRSIIRPLQAFPYLISPMLAHACMAATVHIASDHTDLISDNLMF